MTLIPLAISEKGTPMDGMTHFINIDRRSLIRENTLLQNRNPIDGLHLLVHLMCLTLLAQFLHIFHQLIGQIVMEPIQEILLLANLDLDDHLSHVVELGSHIHRSGEQVILLIGHAVGLASLHNLSIRYIQL